MKKQFDKIMTKMGRKRVIMDRDGIHPYMIRYYIFLKDRKKFPCNVFIHNFLRSDPDDLHDHPFNWGTIILKGGYWEWIPKYRKFEINGKFAYTDEIVGEQKVWRGPGTIRFNKAQAYHRIEIEPEVDCWTLFMTGRRVREWGFLTHKAWNLATFRWIRFDRYIDKRTHQTME